MGLRIAVYERVGTEGFNSLGEKERIAGEWFEERTEMRRSLDDDTFGNAIRGEVGTELEERGGGRILLLDALEGEGPGGGDRIGMVFDEGTTLC